MILEHDVSLTKVYLYSAQRWNRVSGSRVTRSTGQRFWPDRVGSGRVTGQCVRPGFWPGFEF